MNEVEIIKLKSFTKKSGTLVPINFNNKFPIKVKRIFYIFGKKNKYRGDHAHKKCKQLFIPVSGNIALIMKKNDKKKTIVLNSKNNRAFLVPNLIWCRLKFLTKNAIVLVVCDRKYEFNDYIGNYTNFKKIEKSK
jgi:dTDP-4-dehydrorhamnose 3,5-epimerase-like enzyme|tara:strand:- start:330 stop:734 length:405 start_codon:yes stop_codon:yes gene_type:complete